jgi:hypothetical protein
MSAALPTACLIGAPHPAYPDRAFIGLLQPLGAIMPVRRRAIGSGAMVA